MGNVGMHVPAEVGSHVDLCGLHCLPQDTVLRLVPFADARDYVDVDDLPLTVKGKEATFAVSWMTSDSQLRKRDIKGFCDYLYHYLYPQSIKVTVYTESHRREL